MNMKMMMLTTVLGAFAMTGAQALKDPKEHVAMPAAAEVKDVSENAVAEAPKMEEKAMAKDKMKCEMKKEKKEKKHKHHKKMKEEKKMDMPKEEMKK